MTKYSFLGAVVLAASALASPAMAQQVIYNPGYCAQFYPNANCQNLGPGNPYTGSYQRRAAYQQNYNRWDTGNPYTGGYQQRVAYQPTGWNTSYNRWDTGNPYTRGYQQRAAYQPTGWNTATTAGTLEIPTPAVISRAPPTSRPAGTTATTAGTLEIRTPAVISSAPPTSRPAGTLATIAGTLEIPTPAVISRAPPTSRQPRPMRPSTTATAVAITASPMPSKAGWSARRAPGTGAKTAAGTFANRVILSRLCEKGGLRAAFFARPGIRRLRGSGPSPASLIFDRPNAGQNASRRLHAIHRSTAGLAQR